MNMTELACKDQTFAARLAHLTQTHGNYASLDGVVIFTLSDICGFTPVISRQTKIAVCEAHGPNTPLYSTGKLEQALDGCCDVWVVLSRHEFEPSDDWYRRILPQDRIRKTTERSSDIIEPWFDIMLELWAKLSKKAQGNYHDLTHIEWVDDAKVILGSYGVEFGDSFDGSTNRSTWKKI